MSADREKIARKLCIGTEEVRCDNCALSTRLGGIYLCEIGRRVLNDDFCYEFTLNRESILADKQTNKKLPKRIVCDFCGHIMYGNKEEVKFCYNCGMKIDDE